LHLAGWGKKNQIVVVVDDDQGEATIRLALEKPPRKRVLLHLGSIHGVARVAGSENPELME
jgi:hypothetical protein